MSDSFAPGESTAKFEMNGGFFPYWFYYLFGGLFLLGAIGLGFNPSAGDSPSQSRGSAFFGFGLAMILLGIGRAKSRRCVKWIRTADRGGIQWYAHGRVWEHTWDQLARIDTHTTILVDVNGNEGLGDHRMTVTFTDGATFNLRMIECDQYLVLLRYLQAKQDQAAATRRGAQYVASLDAKQRAVDDQVTTFGPLGIYRRGVEWNGIYYPWEQIEGYEIQQGILIIRTIDGDEFLKRTAELGDWRTAVERLEAARGKMAGRRASARK